MGMGGRKFDYNREKGSESRGKEKRTIQSWHCRRCFMLFAHYCTHMTTQDKQQGVYECGWPWYLFGSRRVWTEK